MISLKMQVSALWLKVDLVGKYVITEHMLLKEQTSKAGKAAPCENVPAPLNLIQKSHVIVYQRNQRQVNKKNSS